MAKWPVCDLDVWRVTALGYLSSQFLPLTDHLKVQVSSPTSLARFLAVEIGCSVTVHVKGLKQLTAKELMHHFSSRDFYNSA